MATAANTTPVVWRVSSYSTNAGGNCVQAGQPRGDTGHAGYSSRVLLRDSKHPTDGHLTCAAAHWHTFLAALR